MVKSVTCSFLIDKRLILLSYVGIPFFLCEKLEFQI